MGFHPPSPYLFVYDDAGVVFDRQRQVIPLSQFARKDLELQAKMSKITDYIIDKIDSHTNRYTILEYFLKTFKTEL